jgi:alpha-1,2-glucosyltransferase
MDEPFHIDQAEAYCRGDFSYWNEKITTPPGLYFFSIGLKYLFGLGCALAELRFTNIVFLFGIGLLVYLIVIKKTKENHLTAALHSFSVALFPFVFFFSFLYYTDVGSLFFVLLSYYLCLEHCFTWAALSSSVACTFRQTNIIWAFFVAALSARDLLEFELKKKKISFVDLVLEAFQNLLVLLRNLYGFILLGVGFLIFVHYNGGIVLGDKSNHQAAVHLAQILYFSCFCAFFLLLVTNPLKFLTSLTKLRRKKGFINMIIAFILLNSIALYIAHNYTIEHPFLLSDNRHYTFYIWKNIYRRFDQAKYFLAPVYAFCIAYTAGVMINLEDSVFTVMYSICVAATLIPSPLLEFRYFLIPYILLRLQLVRVRNIRLITEISVMFLVNAVTLYVFIHKPFVDKNGVTQRFMW